MRTRNLTFDLSLAKFIFAMCATLTLASCGPIRNDTIDGPYRLVAVDILEDMIVCYELQEGCSGRVPETVFSVGFNENYVVAARHPHKFGDEVLNRLNTEYYYIIRGADGPNVDPLTSVRGPFNEIDFQRERQRLNLPNFTTEISSLK
jgi:hypothetical protein